MLFIQGFLIASILSVGWCFTVQYCEGSALNRCNLTQLAECVSSELRGVNIYTAKDPNSCFEQINIYTDDMGLTDELQHSPEDQSKHKAVVRKCLQEAGVRANVINDQSQQTYDFIAENYDYNVFTYEDSTRSGNSGELNCKGGSSADATKGPARNLIHLNLFFFAAQFLMGKRTGSLGGPATGTCYSTPGKVASSVEVSNWQEYEVDFKYWPHHYCRSHSKNGSTQPWPDADMISIVAGITLCDLPGIKSGMIVDNVNFVQYWLTMDDNTTESAVRNAHHQTLRDHAGRRGRMVVYLNDTLNYTQESMELNDHQYAILCEAQANNELIVDYEHDSDFNAIHSDECACEE